MARAIALARSHRTHPNPRVGAVIVSSSGEVIAEGAHLGPGEDHAETAALKSASGPVAGAVMYVSLEPCAHRGKTPPCVDAIIEAGVRRVVVGAVDPDERVSGAGCERLREAGVEVAAGVMAEEARAADPGYHRHRETGLPLVTVKYAMTLDGSAAAADGTSRWITSQEARRDAHALRSESDAVVVGSGTLRADDPRLDVRLPGYQGPQPRAVVVKGRAALAPWARVWERDPIVVTTEPGDAPSGETATAPGDGGRPDPEGACRALAERGLFDVLLEGGPTLAGAWMSAGVVSRGVVYIGGRLGGGAGAQPLGGVFSSIAAACDVTISGVRTLGPDIRIDFEL